VSAANILGRYEIVAELGSGGWASVYVARVLDAVGDERQVALKVLHPHLARVPENVTSFLDEARVTTRLRHPHVVSTLDVGATRDGRYFLVLDLVRGLPLSTLRTRVGARVDPRLALRIILDALDALAYVHDAADEWGRPLGIVHRDLTPRNLLIGADGMVRVSDFGIADARLRVTQSPSGIVRGTVGYLAPEQALGEASDRRTDLFTAGVVLWELLTHERLFARANDAASLLAAVSSDAPRPSSIDPRLAPFDAVLGRAMARKAEDRFESAASMAAALREMSGAVGGIADRDALAALVRTSAADELGRIARAVETGGIAPAERQSPNTPHASPPFIGRRVELARVLALLDAGARAIVLTGLGGVGKTRLMREVASAARNADGAVTTIWVNLADLTDATQLEGRIAASLGASDERALADLLISRGPLVLMLDNLEHLLPAADSAVQRMLDVAPALQIVATTRVELNVDDAHAVEVLPLDVPALDEPLDSSSAGQLLLALLARRGLSVADHAVLGAIVRKIGGIPLAIELVVGRLDTLSPGEVLTRLDHQLTLLARPGQHPRRWSTMEACIDWSWSSLTPYEQEALGHWSVFESAFHATWAERTVNLDAWQNAPSALDVLATLRAKSLVQRRVRDGEPQLLEIAPPVREFALDRLARRGAHDAAVQAHAAAFVALAREHWHEAIDAASQSAASLSAANQEIVTVIVRALDGTVKLDVTALAALFAALGATIEHLRDGHRLAPMLERVVELFAAASGQTAPVRAGQNQAVTDARPDGAALALALAAVARIASAFQRAPLGMRASSVARELAQSADPRTRAEVARAHAYALGSAGRDTDAIESTLAEALPAIRAIGDLPSEARLLCDLADLARWRLDASASVAHFEAVLERLDPAGAMLGDAPRIGSMLAEALLALGAVPRARAAIDRVLRAPHIPPTLSVVTRARAAVLEILESQPEQALRTALGCLRDPAAFPLVLRRARMYAAIAAIACGRPLDAVEHVRHSVRGAPPHERVLAEAIEVLAQVESGDHAAARATVSAAREGMLQDGIRPAAAAAAETAFDIVMLATRPEPPRNLLRMLEASLARPFERDGSAGNHMVIRVIAHVVRGGLQARAETDPRPTAPPGTLMVARGGEWFVTPAGEWVDCSRRPMVGKLVATLARQQGAWIDIADVIAELWPGDRSARAALRNRLHALVAGAKKLDLAAHVESRNGAYRLSDSLPVEWWDAPKP